MKCKKCESEIAEGALVCSVCGATQEEVVQGVAEVTAEETEIAAVSAEIAEETAVTAEELIEETAEEPTEENAEETAEEVVVVETLEVPAEKPAKSKVKAWQVVLGVFASLIVLAALAIVLLTAFGVELRPKANDIHRKDVYTVSDENAEKNGSKVVAVLEGNELTNTMLQLFYRMSVVEYLNANADYLSYMNIDLKKPLSEQTCYEDDSMTWEQFFVVSAIETWRNYQTVYMMAMEEGYVPTEELTHSLEELPATMEAMATEEGFESGDALIADRFGAGCTVADYEAYCRLYYVSAEYINIEPTAEQIAGYYAGNEDMFKQYGIDKESGNTVNVRHILICPEGGTTDPETNAVTFTQEQWDACLAKAEGLYNDWKNGEATEASFAALANEKSEDGGSNTNGGLYTGITKETSFVEPFLNWCMDETREVGNTGIVKTDYGYHIMYFAHSQPQWEYYATTYFLSEYTSKKIEEGRAKWSIDITYKNIALSQLELA